MISGFRPIPCLCVLAALTASLAPSQPAPRLLIDRIRMGTDAEVTFDTQPGIIDPDAASEIAHSPRSLSRSTSDGHYTVYFLPAQVRPQNAGSYFSYDFYVVAQTPPNTYTRYRVALTSVGSFLDASKETAFHFATSDGRIEIPIFCPTRPALLDQSQARSLTKVAISGDSIQVSLKNLSGLGLLVRVKDAGSPGLAVSLPGPDRQYPINPAGARAVDVAIKPAAFPALTHTYKAASLAEPHGRLNLDVQCSFSDYPLLDPDPVRISLPLEFTPSFLHLAATVAAGAIVGWLFCTLADRKSVV